MKHTILIFCLIINFFYIQAQQTVEGISKDYSFNITKEVKPPILSVTNGSFIFSDANNNKAIDANEESKISFTLENNGLGDGYGLSLITTAIGNSQGITFNSNKSLQTLKIGQKLKVELPISANMNTSDGKIIFSLKVDEPNGFGTDTFQMELSTRSFSQPLVEVVDFTLTGSQTGVLTRKIPFDLQVLVQNTKPGVAENVKVNFILPDGVLCVSSNESLDYSTLVAGEKKSIVYSLIVSDKFTGTDIPLKIKLKEKYGKYAKDKDILLKLNQNMSPNKIEVLAEKQNTNINIERGSLTSDVDKNIPNSGIQNLHRYAVIIGNEDYSSQQQGISTEVNVDYAVNDASIFRDYCKLTLGVPERQIRYIENATGSKINQALDWLSVLSKAENGNAELFFYYSGHGLPDEETKEPYIIPVDVSGSNVKQGVKVSQIYNKLTENPAQHITVFFDACFSGGARNMPLIAQKSIRVNPEKVALKGNLVVFASSDGNESSGIFRDKKHGFFTYFLLKKLQETSGDVSYEELKEYIKTNVIKESSLIGKPQTPQVLVAPDVNNVWGSWKIK